VETLPLHWTQKEISKEKDWVIFEYYLIPNFELEQKILSFGTEVKVVKSTKLKNRMRDILQNCLKYYS
jgi:predicted DNA-binding transcriptional regulator YafY